MNDPLGKTLACSACGAGQNFRRSKPHEKCLLVHFWTQALCFCLCMNHGIELGYLLELFTRLALGQTIGFQHGPLYMSVLAESQLLRACPRWRQVNVIHAWCERRAREIGKWLKESFPGGLSLRDTWLVAQKMSLPPRIKEVLKILIITMAAAFQPILSGSVIVEGAQCWQP